MSGTREIFNTLASGVTSVTLLSLIQSATRIGQCLGVEVIALSLFSGTSTMSNIMKGSMYACKDQLANDFQDWQHLVAPAFLVGGSLYLGAKFGVRRLNQWLDTPAAHAPVDVPAPQQIPILPLASALAPRDEEKLPRSSRADGSRKVNRYSR